MSTINFFRARITQHPHPEWLLDWFYSLLYWLAFLLVLEPGNLYRASHLAQMPSFTHEAIRILVAALLGTICTPVLQLMAQRFPIVLPFSGRHILLHLGCVLGLALGLILLSCLLAAWIFAHEWVPTLAAIHKEIVGNYLLLVYAIVGYAVIIQISYVLRYSNVPPISLAGATYLTRIEVKSRGKLMFVEVSDIDWIETQGNYLALHVGTEVHLIRETLIKFTAQLEANRFVQVHRRVVVAISRIKNIQPLTNGDSILLLTTGCELRASRRHREEILKLWRGD